MKQLPPDVRSTFMELYDSWWHHYQTGKELGAPIDSSESTSLEKANA